MTTLSVGSTACPSSVSLWFQPNSSVTLRVFPGLTASFIRQSYDGGAPFGRQRRYSSISTALSSFPEALRSTSSNEGTSGLTLISLTSTEGALLSTRGGTSSTSARLTTESVSGSTP